MEKSETEIDEMKGMMAVARRRALNFGFCLGNTYKTAFLILHRWRSLEFLRREARWQGETNKFIVGSLKLKSNTLTLTCDGSVPGNTARQMRFMLREYDLLFKIEIIEGNATIQVEGEDDGKGDVASAPSARAIDSKIAAQWGKLLPVFEDAVSRTVSEDGQKADAIQSAWDGAKFAAGEGRFKTALAVAKKIKPLLVPKSNT